MGEFDLEAEPGGELVDDFDGGRHHFRANAVAGYRRDLMHFVLGFDSCSVACFIKYITIVMALIVQPIYDG
jgi:hypothetical protein